MRVRLRGRGKKLCREERVEVLRVRTAQEKENSWRKALRAQLFVGQVRLLTLC